MRVNKYTYETEVVYIEKESSAFVNWNGYRMAVEYNGKLYFACAGFPTSRLLQIDPETNETKVVMQKTAENSGFANGIRGLTVMDGKLLVSLATDGADPDNMFASGSQMPQQASITNRDSPYTAVIRKKTGPGTGHRSSETHPKVPNMNSVLERKNPAQVTCSHTATISTSAAITTRCLTSPKSVMPVISSLSMKI